MSNHLSDVSVQPTTVKSGSSVKASVDYQSDDGGPLHISSGGGFSISPNSQTLGATPSGNSTFSLTITRGSATTKSCLLTFSFFNSQRDILVDIT